MLIFDIEWTSDLSMQLTDDERALVDFVRELSDWAEPHHDYTRPPPAVVLAEAAKVSEQRTGHPLRGIEIPPLPANGSTNGNWKKDEEQPPVKDAPELVLNFFDGKFLNAVLCVWDQANELLQVSGNVSRRLSSSSRHWRLLL